MEGRIKAEFGRMKQKFKLVKTVHTNGKAAVTDRLEYEPTLKPYDEYVTLVVSGPMVEEVINALGYPGNKGDSMILELTKTEEQSELPGKGENGKKSGRTAKADAGKP